MRRLRPSAIVLALALAGVSACAPTMTPLQERAWHAFQDCQAVARTASLVQITPDGRIAFGAEDTDMPKMKQCLRDRWGYPFVN